ncbi:MAG: glycosyltransferase [Spirochaetia bacterium]|nr:glycosyltransferase [Spirochaetia bacterium]
MAERQPHTDFRRQVEARLRVILDAEKTNFGFGHSLKIDLHTHDELSGRSPESIPALLNAASSYTPTDELLRCLGENGMDSFAITNGESGRSAFQLLDKGMDIVVGAGFRAHDKATGFDAQVLVYGFSPAEEVILQKKSRDLLAFVEYTRERDLPTVLAHPLKVLYSNAEPPVEFFERLALLFDNFEVLNGNTDLYHSLLTAEWVKSLTREKLEGLEKKTGLKANLFTRRPFEKKMVGGSDDRVGLLAGCTYTLCGIPEGASQDKKSEQIVEALRQGRVRPEGFFEREILHPVSLLTYFLDLSIHLREPGLSRILFGHGTGRDKTLAFAAWNLAFEAQSFPFGKSILRVLRKAFLGKRPGLLLRAFLPAPFRGFLEELDSLARARQSKKEPFRLALGEFFPRLAARSHGLIKKDLEKILKEMTDADGPPTENGFFSFMELPAALRSLASQNGFSTLKKIFQGLGRAGGSFKEIRLPVAVSSLIAGASFASSSILTHFRNFETRFARSQGLTARPEHLLWITDTFHDSNGVSRFLSSFHHEAVKHNLPVDFLITSSQRKNEPHLHVLPPFLEFTLEKYHDQPIRLPDMTELHRFYAEGGYDRLLLSTEGPLGAASLFFRYAFHLPISFYMHTDWLDFARKTLHFDEGRLEKLEQFFRAGYGLFDRVFVLNKEHEKWLEGPTMEIPKQKVSLTAHWADDFFVPLQDERQKRFGVSKDDPVFLYAGRISKEKGVMEIPEIIRAVKAVSPGVKMVFAGKGPAVDELKELLPEAIFLGWVDARELPAIYSSADLLLMPSQFDTFGCVILEALATGLPVLAYESKGPADILEADKSGFLATDAADLRRLAVSCAGNLEKLRSLRKGALERSKAYTAERIIQSLLEDIKLDP